MPTKRRKTTFSSETPSASPSQSQVPSLGSDYHGLTESGASDGESKIRSPPLTAGEASPVWAEDDDDMPEEAPAGSEKGKQKSAKGGFEGGYNALKSYKGQYYSGMAVGGSHTWNYDQGVWKETKEEPDLWRIDYATNKRRAKRAPQGSGAPVGTEYHWLIVGHQNVKKVDANTYETHLTGSKYKLAFKSATSNSWSIPTIKKQRERELELLDDAKQRVQGLPPVSDKAKVQKEEKGQTKLDAMFGRIDAKGKKRKVEDRPSTDLVNE